MKFVTDFCRNEPPTEEEVAKNLAIAEMKKVNAAKIEEQRLIDGGSLPAPAEKGHESFPTYSEYHPGDPTNKYRNKWNMIKYYAIIIYFCKYPCWLWNKISISVYVVYFTQRFTECVD